MEISQNGFQKEIKLEQTEFDLIKKKKKQCQNIPHRNEEGKTSIHTVVVVSQY